MTLPRMSSHLSVFELCAIESLLRRLLVCQWIPLIPCLYLRRDLVPALVHDQRVNKGCDHMT